MKAAMLKAAQALSLFLAGMFIGAAISSFAGPQYEVAIGYAKGKTAPEGVWWEHQYPTDNRVASTAYQLGLSYKFADSQWGVRTDYGRILKYSTRNYAVGNENHAAARAAGQVSCNPAEPFNDCILKFSGNGQAWGLHLGVFREFQAHGFKLQPEIGVMPYVYSWSMYVEHAETNNPPVNVNSMVGGRKLAWTEYARFTVQRGMFFARVTYDAFVKGHDPVVGIQEGKVLSYMLGAAVSF